MSFLIMILDICFVTGLSNMTLSRNKDKIEAYLTCNVFPDFVFTLKHNLVFTSGSG